MADIQKRPGGSDCCEDCGKEECKCKGKRGHRGPSGPEGPTGAAGISGATGPTGPTGTPPVLAAALVFSNGTFPGNHPGFSAVVHAGTGLYTLTLTNPPLDFNNLVVVATLAAVVSGEIVYLAGSNPISISTFDAANAPADKIFSIVVYDVT